MKLNKISLLAILISTPLFAWTSKGEVTEVISHNGLHIINTTITDSPCSKQFYWPKSDPDADDMFSLALTAFMSGKKLVSTTQA